MCAQEQIHRQTLQDLEPLYVVFGDLGVVFVSDEQTAAIHIRTADNNRIQFPSAFVDLHGPRGASLGVTGRLVCRQLRTAEFDGVSVTQYAVDLRAGTPLPWALGFRTIRVHDHPPRPR